jgi:HAMP domain-containing protein
MSGQKDDAAKGDVIASLRAELKRKDDEIIAKEITINRLVREKADQLTQLSEIPYLRDEIKELEEQVRALAQLLNVFIVGGNGLTPEQQLVMLRLLSPSAQPKPETPPTVKDEQ